MVTKTIQQISSDYQEEIDKAKSDYGSSPQEDWELFNDLFKELGWTKESPDEEGEVGWTDEEYSVTGERETIIKYILSHEQKIREEERKKALKAISEAFYDGVEQGGTEDAGDAFVASDYLEE